MATDRRSALLPSKSFLFAFTAAHAALTVFLFLVTFNRGMSRFDTGAPPTPADNVLESASTVLIFPLGTLAMRWDLAPVFFPGLLGYLPVVANSLVWALVAWWLVVALRQGRLATSSPGQ